MLRKKLEKRQYFLFLTAMVLVAVGCRSKDRPASSFNAEDIFFDYKISGRETDDKLTVLLQFREGEEDGNAISIAEWGKVTLDGEELMGDSSKRTGFFYETHRAIGDFAGKHTIVLSGGEEEEYKEDFDFQRVELLTEVPDTLAREELVLEFAGLEPEDYLRVLIVDTSVINEGINRVDTLQNGRLIITSEDLQKLESGPVQLLFFRELVIPTKASTNKGGRILITYSLGREFFLKDQAE